jgi:hypothetical protein
MDARLRAVCDLLIPEVREAAGLHVYDGAVQDLSPDGVTAGLARLGGPPLDDAHDDAHLAAAETRVRVELGELADHRRNPLWHLQNLDLAVYDRDYAPAEERLTARHRHLSAWPEAVDAAVAALDRVPATVARALLPGLRGLAAAVTPGTPGAEAALAAHARLVAHVEGFAVDGASDEGAALGGDGLARLLGAHEATQVDLGRLALQADAERDRLRAMLAEDCDRLRPGVPVGQVVAELQRDHPDSDGVLAEAQALTDEVLDWTRASGLVPEHDGLCMVGPAPESRSFVMAMMAWAGPWEDDAPSWYYVTPPDPAWPAADRAAWLEVFNRTTLPAITVHEVAPGHFTHGRMLRRAAGDVRRTLHGLAFVEGWAHYAEELLVEEGFRDDDPRYRIGVAIEALIRVTRLAVSVGVHVGAMTIADAEARFAADAFQHGAAARSEAVRATFDPTYGRYTWGKLAILALRDEARRRWGSGYSHRRFHTALLDLGAPPLGLLPTALERG